MKLRRAPGANLTKGSTQDVGPQGRPLALNKNDYIVKLSSPWRDPLGERIYVGSEIEQNIWSFCSKQGRVGALYAGFPPGLLFYAEAPWGAVPQGGPQGRSAAPEEAPGTSPERRRDRAAHGPERRGRAAAGEARRTATEGGPPAPTEQQHIFCSILVFEQNICFVISGRGAGRSRRAPPGEAGRGTGAGDAHRAQARSGPGPTRPGRPTGAAPPT